MTTWNCRGFAMWHIERSNGYYIFNPTHYDSPVALCGKDLSTLNDRTTRRQKNKGPICKSCLRLLGKRKK